MSSIEEKAQTYAATMAAAGMDVTVTSDYPGHIRVSGRAAGADAELDIELERKSCYRWLPRRPGGEPPELPKGWLEALAVQE